MFYRTSIDDDTHLMLEAPAVGTLDKFGMEDPPNPETAFVRSVDMALLVARRWATVFRAAGVDAEVEFAMKCDGNGVVMVAEGPDKGQFRCKLRFDAP